MLHSHSSHPIVTRRSLFALTEMWLFGYGKNFGKIKSLFYQHRVTHDSFFIIFEKFFLFSTKNLLQTIEQETMRNHSITQLVKHHPNSHTLFSLTKMWLLWVGKVCKFYNDCRFSDTTCLFSIIYFLSFGFWTWPH